METASITVALIAGFIIGLITAFVLTKFFLIRDKENTIESVKARFSDVSREALEHFFMVAKERFDSEKKQHGHELDSKKGLIDKQLESMTTELTKVSKLVNELEKDREKKFGELSSQVEEASRQTRELTQATGTLREALASSKTRGQWGERMTEDVLRLAGFIENVNYVKQKKIEGSGEKPDFTFLLPRSLVLNMDVKFPYDNYIKYIEAESDSEKENFRKKFLGDVKSRIKEVTSRDYINPEQNTVDYVLLFIPNESIFSFIQEQESTIVDDGIQKHVIICSPLTLFAILAVIRAAVDNFALEQTSNRILSLLGSFKKQWGNFIDSLEKLGRHITTTQTEYEKLITTRRRQLERPLNEIEEIRTQRTLPLEEPGNDEELPEDDDSEDE